MYMIPVIAGLGVALLQPPQVTPPELRLDVRAERGLGGVQGDGWQHIALELQNPTGQPIAGRATLYEWVSRIGARPRIELPFAVTDRQVLHFYPFRPTETPDPSSYVITLEGDGAHPIAINIGTQYVINGKSTSAIRVDMGSTPMGDFRVGIWGDSTTYLRSLVSEWSPTFDDLYRAGRGATVNQWRRLAQSKGQINLEVISLEDFKLLPDSSLGYAGLNLLLAIGVDLDSQLTERQRRALADWVQCGGQLVVAPRKGIHLTGPLVGGLAGLHDRGEKTTDDDSHLDPEGGGPPHRVVHFLTTVDPPRPVDVVITHESDPVVFSVPAGFGQVWIVAFDPEAHGGLRRYQPIWVEILKRALEHEVRAGINPQSHFLQFWSPETDRQWLQALGQRFGKLPSVEHLAIVILAYLVVVGPINSFVLKRREARVWLIATVPALAAIFGGAVLSMGYLSHGLRAATNQVGIAIVTPEGDRAYAEEFVLVYGTTSAEYRLDFPRSMAVRPVGEYAASDSGGFDNPGSFRLQAHEDRMWLRDWRLTFWQTRAVGSSSCVAIDGRLTATRDGAELSITNETEILFDSVFLAGMVHRPALGSLEPFASRTVTLDLADINNPDPLLSRPGILPGADAASMEEPPNYEEQMLVNAVAGRLQAVRGEWMLGVTRKPVHEVKSPDARKHFITTIYAWPVRRADGVFDNSSSLLSR